MIDSELKPLIRPTRRGVVKGGLCLASGFLTNHAFNQIAWAFNEEDTPSIPPSKDVWMMNALNPKQTDINGLFIISPPFTPHEPQTTDGFIFYAKPEALMKSLSMDPATLPEERAVVSFTWQKPDFKLVSILLPSQTGYLEFGFLIGREEEKGKFRGSYQGVFRGIVPELGINISGKWKDWNFYPQFSLNRMSNNIFPPYKSIPPLFDPNSTLS